MHRRFSSCLFWGAFCITFAAATHTQAQEARRRTTPRKPDKAPDTQLEIHLLTSDAASNRYAQQWADYFRQKDVAVRIRSRTQRDEPGVTERSIGDSVRWVTVLAELDRRGHVTLPERSFALSDGGKLAEWLDELRTYGAQGSPDGQPVWGLTKEQLDQVLAALKRPLAIDPQGKDLLAALVLFAPDVDRGDLPIHVTPEAKEIMAQPQGERLFPQSLAGLSRGTALAVLLRYYGLCFSPQRTPSGGLELVLRDSAATKQPWRIGWPWPKETPRDKIAPNLFKFVNVELDDLALSDVFSAAAESIDIPILIDYAGMDEWHIEYDKIRVTYPRKKTTWGLAIQRIAFQSRLRRELYVDEAGKPFVWITPIEFKRKPTGDDQNEKVDAD